MARTVRPAIALVLVGALAACGGATPAASPGGGATPEPVATAGGATPAAATQDPGATTGGESSPAAGGIDIGGAAASLEDLDNYSFRIEMRAEGASEFMMVPSGGSLVMEGDVVLAPTEAVDVRMITNDGTTESVLGYRIIDDTAYLSLDGESWMTAGTEDARQAVDGFKPQQILGSYRDLEGLRKVGDEDRNGIPSEHWSTTYDPGIGDMFGLPSATWTSDVWIARDGGYMVSAAMVATGSTDTGESGTFTMTVDVTGANDPDLVIEAPENVTDLGG
jgi:hypothetical protein